MAQASRVKSAPARATFRPKRREVAWQKELRDRHLSEGAPFELVPPLREARVRAISYRLAQQVILKYEWLGTMAKTQYHYGLFFGLHCAGVTCAGVGGTAGNNTHKPFGIERHQLLTLARGACVHWAPPGSNSKLVAWTVKRLARDVADSKVLIAYADTDAGEIGTIYQAAGWTYIGPSGWTPQYVAPNGRIYDCRIVSDLAGKSGVSWVQQRDAMLRHGWREQRSNPKHRYVAVLDSKDKRLVELVRSMRKPYPKRAGEVQ